MARTEDDTWDPATGVGMTATFGAVARAVATNKGLINDPFAERLVRAAGVHYFTQMVENGQYSDDGADKSITTALLTMLWAHTRFLDDYLADAGRAGIRQVVLLASGLDTRPYRLWWPSGTTVYEIDQPAVIDFKSDVLRGLGAELSANRRAVGADLRHDWLAALGRVGFDAAQPTVWIVENLLVGVPTAGRAGSAAARRHRGKRDRQPVRRRSPPDLEPIAAGGQSRVRRPVAAIRAGRRPGRTGLSG